MKREKFLALILSIICIFSSFTTNVFALNDEKDNKYSTEKKGLDIEARSGLLIEPTTGKVLFQKNQHEKYAPASVTKIMTMLLTIEAVDSGKIKLSDKVTVSENAKKMGGSTMLLDTGEIRTVEELLKGVAIASGNDAAVALSEYLGGSEDAFVEKMNKRAKALGMKNTTFKNCTGLPKEGHLSTAYDISLMSRELLKHPKILKYTGTYMEEISEGRKSPISLINHNKLVRFFKGCDGLKTGYTEDAKYCISATALKNNVRMLSIIMGAPTYKIRNRDASNLMNYGFSKFEFKTIVKKGSEIERVVFNKKGDKLLIARAKEEFSIPVERGENAKIEKKITIDRNRKQYKRGESIGYCDVLVNGKLIKRIEIYSDRDLKVGNFLNNLKDNISKIFDNAV